MSIEEIIERGASLGLTLAFVKKDAVFPETEDTYDFELRLSPLKTYVIRFPISKGQRVGETFLEHFVWRRKTAKKTGEGAVTSAVYALSFANAMCLPKAPEAPDAGTRYFDQTDAMPYTSSTPRACVCADGSDVEPKEETNVAMCVIGTAIALFSENLHTISDSEYKIALAAGLNDLAAVKYAYEELRFQKSLAVIENDIRLGKQAEAKSKTYAVGTPCNDEGWTFESGFYYPDAMTRDDIERHKQTIEALGRVNRDVERLKGKACRCS